jgi:hypothetical protein
MTSLVIRPGALVAPQLDYFLIDGSGSMQGKWWESLGTIDAFLDVLKTSNIASHGIISVFDSHDRALIQRDGLIGEWPTMAEQPLAAHWGATPLYDAINIMGRELAALRPAKCSIVIVTDGEENGSTHTTAAQARAILDWCRAQGWQVTFLGADFNNARQAALLGSTPSNSLGIQKMRMIEAGKTLGEKRVRHAHAGTDISFTDDEKADFGGYLSDNSGGAS